MDKYFNKSAELKKLWNMKVNHCRVLGMVPKSLEKSLEELDIKGRIETIQTTALQKSTWILSPRDLRTLDVTHTPVNDH